MSSRENNKRKRDQEEEEPMNDDKPTDKNISKELSVSLHKKETYTVAQLLASDKVREQHIRRGCIHHHEHGLAIFQKPNAYNIPTEIQVTLIQLDEKALQPDPTKEQIVLYFHAWTLFERSQLFREHSKQELEHRGKRLEKIEFKSSSREALLIFAFSFYCSQSYDEFSGDILSKLDGSKKDSPSRDKPLEKLSRKVLLEVWKLALYWKMFPVLKKTTKKIEEILLNTTTTFEECAGFYLELEPMLDLRLDDPTAAIIPSQYYCSTLKHNNLPILEIADDMFFIDALVDIFANVFLSYHWENVKHGTTTMISVNMLLEMSMSYFNRFKKCQMCSIDGFHKSLIEIPRWTLFIPFYCKTMLKHGGKTSLNGLDLLIKFLQDNKACITLSNLSELSNELSNVFGKLENLSLEKLLLEAELMRKLLRYEPDEKSIYKNQPK